ncbi:Gamma-glutamyl hydrolase [Holothuria leucospilota]|uniref:folate gamma-glutamyl hydrolase n=1 Tax=Holothuria leucospilota TaxID=206669 RepID=A0A9Q1H8I7_HOLLE|nr:Gamma-glutamyl hydrolase [Holothuria leucospilota]
MTQATPTPLIEYGSTYLPATYVKFIESAGARVVPIFVNKDDDYYEKLFNSINGVMWPGGGLDNLTGSGYGQAGKIFYDLAIKSNKAGDYFPIWGTCQGFELIVSLIAGKNVLAPLESIDKNLNVNLSPGNLNIAVVCKYSGLCSSIGLSKRKTLGDLFRTFCNSDFSLSE